MKQAIKTAWVKALRSEDYVQGTGSLATSGKHCCLGVLARILADEFPETYAESGCKLREDQQGRMEIIYPGCNGIGRTGGLPRDLCAVIELDHDEAQNDLASRNDNGVSFRDIADYIERTL